MTELGTFSMPDLDEMARKEIKAGRMKQKDKEAEPSALPAAEYRRLMEGSADDRIAFRAAAKERLHPLPTDEVTTGQEAWDANGGRSPNPDEVERNTGGKFRLATEDEVGSGEISIVEVATGRRASIERPRPTLTVQG